MLPRRPRAWHLYEINDDAREVFGGLTEKSDWFAALDALGHSQEWLCYKTPNPDGLSS
jgi:hypothetical protein